ncbi:ankyrin repeat-containing 2B [Raphanus sativus]|uniref:Ankyrin repeat domain-containing protein 2B n=1 Tax=Raphanus sativus TaxID=3726 RepID=A0A6J0KE89_RAPSA|nr:ankyrin repeat domain-containing protein 2B [Raphanus sativus]KAJ4884310.1 ankyrin repeat-containing 2B [Raphanus sativus]
MCVFGFSYIFFLFLCKSLLHLPCSLRGFQTDQRMASAGSEKTLPCPASKTTSPALALKFDALDFPAMKAMEDFQTCISELGEKMREDPAYIQELRRCNPAAKFDVKNTMQMFQRLRDNARQDPRASLENLVKPGALEEFAERVTQLRKDPEVELILAELDACPAAALLKFADDKQVLKKLGNSMLRSQGLNYDADDEELFSEGRKALEIAFGYAKMKCYKILVDAQRKKANKVEGKKKTSGKKTKRSSLLSNKCDAV